MSHKTVSVVIPAYNCEQTIREVLDAVLRQDYPGKIEIIVIDDGSADKTFSIAKSYKDVIYVRQENLGPAAARNRGFKISTGEFVFFTDSDCIPEPNWVKSSLLHFTDPKIAVVAGSYGIMNDIFLLARCIHKEILYRHSYKIGDYPKSFGSYNFGVRRNIFESVGGFNEGYRFASGEDNDLSYKIFESGCKIYFERKSVVRHYFPTNAAKYLTEQYRHGFWRAKIYFDHPKMTLGDDYTFWKDIVEPPISLIFLVCLVAAMAGSMLFCYAALNALAFLLVIEFFYGWLITKDIPETLFLATIMFLRSFARAFGFLNGFLAFFLPKICKKN